MRADVDRLAREAIARFGHVDVWVNNAGRGITKGVLELTDEDFDQMMTVNVKSALYGMQAIAPHLRERRSGQIVNVSSMLGRVPWAPQRSAYSAAKHALNALTENARQELAPAGVNVCCLMPGVVHTDFGLSALHGGLDSRTMPGQSAPEVAVIIADAIQSQRNGDVYTPPGAIDRVLAHVKDLSTK